MLSKKVLKDIQSLSLKKHRDETGLFLAEGPKVVEELLQVAPAQVVQVYALAEWHSAHADRVTVTETELQRMSALKTPNKVVAVVKKFGIGEEPGSSAFSLYLDRVQDPGNLGTIIRIADWFGIKNVVCSAGCADAYNPKTLQATMASIARVNVFEDCDATWLKRQIGPIYAAVLNGNSLYDEPAANAGTLVIGNESKGISDDVLALTTKRVTIPRKGEAESLNAAVATGILLSHFLR